MAASVAPKNGFHASSVSRSVVRRTRSSRRRRERADRPSALSTTRRSPRRERRSRRVQLPSPSAAARREPERCSLETSAVCSSSLDSARRADCSRKKTDMEVPARRLPISGRDARDVRISTWQPCSSRLEPPCIRSRCTSCSVPRRRCDATTPADVDHETTPLFVPIRGETSRPWTFGATTRRRGATRRRRRRRDGASVCIVEQHAPFSSDSPARADRRASSRGETRAALPGGGGGGGTGGRSLARFSIRRSWTVGGVFDDARRDARDARLEQSALRERRRRPAEQLSRGIPRVHAPPAHRAAPPPSSRPAPPGKRPVRPPLCTGDFLHFRRLRPASSTRARRSSIWWRRERPSCSRIARRPRRRASAGGRTGRDVVTRPRARRAGPAVSPPLERRSRRNFGRRASPTGNVVEVENGQWTGRRPTEARATGTRRAARASGARISPRPRPRRVTARVRAKNARGPRWTPSRRGSGSIAAAGPNRPRRASRVQLAVGMFPRLRNPS